MSGQKIIEGLRDAVAGNLARITINGVTYVRDDMPVTDQTTELQSLLGEWLKWYRTSSGVDYSDDSLPGRTDRILYR